jgi:flagellar biosynthesis chaperone FliJ
MVLEIREQALHEKAGILVQAHEGRELAQDHAASTANHLVEAKEYRNALAASSISLTSWIDAEQWLAHKNQQNALAQSDLQNAELYLNQAHEGVLEARSNVKRMELLDKRLATSELQQESRFEQKSNDELARRKYVNARRGETD